MNFGCCVCLWLCVLLCICLFIVSILSFYALFNCPSGTNKVNWFDYVAFKSASTRVIVFSYLNVEQWYHKKPCHIPHWAAQWPWWKQGHSKHSSRKEKERNVFGHQILLALFKAIVLCEKWNPESGHALTEGANRMSPWVRAGCLSSAAVALPHSSHKHLVAPAKPHQQQPTPCHDAREWNSKELLTGLTSYPRRTKFRSGDTANLEALKVACKTRNGWNNTRASDIWNEWMLLTRLHWCIRTWWLR